MRADLEDKLVRRFPILYRSKAWSMKETCMCWGFSCQKGWFPIIWMLSLAIEDDMKNHFNWLEIRHPAKLEWLRDKYNSALRAIIRPPFTFPKKHWKDSLFFKLKSDFSLPAVTQVKEKFGTLRFYFGSNDVIDGFVRAAEAASSRICEECGRYGTLRDNTFWHYTACTDHVQNWQDFTKWELETESETKKRRDKMKKDWTEVWKKAKKNVKKVFPKGKKK